MDSPCPEVTDWPKRWSVGEIPPEEIPGLGTRAPRAGPSVRGRGTIENESTPGRFPGVDSTVCLRLGRLAPGRVAGGTRDTASRALEVPGNLAPRLRMVGRVGSTQELVVLLS